MTLNPYLIFILSVFFISWNYVLAEQVTSTVDIVGFQPIEEGGTLSFETSQEMIMNFTLPDDTSGELLVTTTEVENPTTDGFTISFLDEVLTMIISPADSCLAGCDITFTFDDNHLISAGILDPSQVVIYQDTEEDGTFVPLVTILIDDAPSPYTVLATITSTSFFGIGVLDEETFCGKTIEQWEDSGANVIIGTEKNDKLRGTNGIDVILGLGGNDRILGKDGDDCLIGGDGKDRIIGGKGNDIIFGNDGKDRLHGGKGNDIINAGDGKDRITGNSGDDVLTGGSGKDKIYGNNGDDNLFGNSGNDDLKGGSGDDFLDGGEDFDKCKGGSGNNQIINCEDGKPPKHDDKKDKNEKDDDD